MQKHNHCSYCGAAFGENRAWPRTCAACNQISFLNPTPVTIVLLPVWLQADIGVVAVRRAIEPQRGQLALPGGYVDYGETWQETGAREMREEAGIEIDPGELRPIEVFSAADGTLILVGIAAPLSYADLSTFYPNAESSAREILTRPVPMAFDLHTKLVTQYLSGQTLGYTARKPHSVVP